jgi:hypothetical protein
MSIDREVRNCSDHVALLKSTPSFQNHAWRERVAEWFYDVIDHLDVPRETVYLAMNILDRYVAVNSEVQSLDKLEYESAAITSLFLAVRVSGAMDLKIPELLQLSRSSAQVRDILSTGTRILETLTWDHLIPTPTDFIKVLLGLLKSSIDSKTAISLFELSAYIVEISVYDQHLCGTPAPKVAFAALLISIKSVDGCTRDRKTFTHFLRMVYDLTGMSYGSADIKSIYSRLRSIYSQSQDSCSSKSPHVILDEDDSNIVHNIESSREITPLLKNTAPSSDVVEIRPISPCPDGSNKRARVA